MKVRKGIGVSPGVAIGETFVLESEEYRIPKRRIPDGAVEEEIARLERALELAIEEVDNLQKKASTKIGAENLIFETHRKIISDPQIKKMLVTMIQHEKVTPEYALTRVLRRWKKIFQGIGDDYFSQRIIDINDVESRVLRNLTGCKREEIQSLSKEVIIVSGDLTPSQTATLDKRKVLGFATDAGGRTSHTAIVARALGIPAVVGLGSISTDVSAGDVIIIDGNGGIVIINPNPKTLEEYQERRRKLLVGIEELEKIKSLPAETPCGERMNIFGNIEFPDEIPEVLQNGGVGVGLYRTEFLITKSRDFPSEEDHFNAYREAVRKVGDYPLVIRTFDFGADKFGERLGLGRERNPFLGCRSIRLSFQRLDIFRPQLRAILRASALGNVWILFPMISSLEEIKQAKVLLSDMMDDLAREKIPFNEKIKVGIMIEVPSAAIASDILAREVDFFSIGTNDLIQYCLAVDRVNEKVAHLYQPSHPAVLRLIQQILENGKKAKIDVNLCGEMSADRLFTIVLMGMGLRNFSISPKVIPEIKRIIRRVTIEEAKRVCKKAISFLDATEAEAYLKKELKDLLPDLFF